MNPDDKLAWHFLRPNGKLRDGKEAVLGKTYRVDPPLVLCEVGLHFSYRALDAVSYSESSIVTLVKVGGTVVMGDDKGCCSERTIVAGPVNAESTLHEFARWCALQVIHLWNCPPIVKEYLETGKEELRVAAWAAARDVARIAARVAARAAAWGVARDVAWDVARVAAYQKYNDHLEAMLLALLKVDVAEAMR